MRDMMEMRNEMVKRRNMDGSISHLSFRTSHIRRGFTLIELLIVFSFIGILTSLGIASYVTFTNSHALQSSTDDVVNILHTAKSRALSQVKPEACGANSLQGYQLDFSIGGQTYALSAQCGTKQQVLSGNLSPNVTFSGGSSASIFFAVSTGIVSSPATVNITGSGKTKTIIVSGTGNITVN